jgi:antitoxin component of RelBE/YafQ-DinJ toxin-antitoxin module
MTPRRIATFRIDDEVLAALKRIYERDGISVPDQVRRALQRWIESKDASETARKPAQKRKRA